MLGHSSTAVCATFTAPDVAATAVCASAKTEFFSSNSSANGNDGPGSQKSDVVIRAQRQIEYDVHAPCAASTANFAAETAS